MAEPQLRGVRRQVTPLSKLHSGRAVPRVYIECRISALAQKNNTFKCQKLELCCATGLEESCDTTNFSSLVVWAQQVLREGVQLPHTCSGKRDAILGHAPHPRPLLHPSCCSAGLRRVVGRLRPPEQRQH